MVKVLVHIFENVVPIHDDLCPRDTLASLHHEVDHILEVRLACWHLPRIYVGGLELCEVQLAGRCVVAVRPEDHYWDLELLQHLHRWP